MGESIEDKILDKEVSFSVKDMKWVITTAVVAVLWIVTAVLWVKSSDAQSDKIRVLETNNSSLQLKVATLEGQVKGVEKASEIFMENPPAELKYRIDLAEKRLNRLELPGSNPPLENTSVNDTSNVVRRGH
jgi:hypothetical protein